MYINDRKPHRGKFIWNSKSMTYAVGTSVSVKFNQQSKPLVLSVWVDRQARLSTLLSDNFLKGYFVHKKNEV